MRVVAVISFLLLLACSDSPFPRQPPPPLFDELSVTATAGCYRTEVGEWQPPIEEASRTLYSLPRTISFTLEATNTPRPTGGGRFAQSYLVKSSVPGEYRGSWYLSGPSEIAFSWTDGFVGVQAKLRRRHSINELAGEIATFTDTGTNTHIATIKLHSASCQ